MEFEHHIYKVPSAPMEWMEEDYEDELKIFRSNMEVFFDTSLMTSSERNLFALFVQSSLLNNPVKQTVRYLYDYQQVMMNKLQPYIHKDRECSITFRNKTVVIKPKPLRKLPVGTWESALYATLILRDPFNQLNDLFSIDQDNFAVNVVNEERTDFYLVLYRLYQGFLGAEEKDLTTLIGDVIEFSAPEFVGESAVQDTVNHLVLPLTQMLVYAHTKDRATKYPEKLMHALDFHRRYFTGGSGVQEDCCDTRGWLSLGITALAAYAYDGFGLEPEVDTEYMPMWLVKGEFPSYEEAFPKLKDLPKPIRIDFKFTAENLPLTEPELTRMYEATLKWAKEERELPLLCDVIGRDIESKKVNKNVVGEIFVEVMGEDSVLTLYSMEPSLIQDLDTWLEIMATRWQAFIAQFSHDAITNVQFVEYE